jgi:hypothetical protein
VQPSAGQDLPHTRTHAVHWLATGVAVVALVMALSLAQPPGADATSATTADTAAAGPAPSATAVRYPVDCAGAPVDVVDQGKADLDADGRTDTVVVVRCHTESGTPPSGVFVLSPGVGPRARPRIVATLLSPAKKLSLSGFQVTGSTVSATVLGYSSDQVPRCCPDLARKFSWVWRDGAFVAVAGPHLGTV